ncbi:MAG TPA: copper chaperone PCu(A)C [Caulobacteraceae bacterium]
MTLRPLQHRLALAGLIIATVGANAVGRPAAPIAVINAWTRPVAAAGMNAAGYMTIINRSAAADQLIGASSAAAVKVSIHQSRQIGTVMTMRAAPSLVVPGKGKAVLAPGAFHLMLEGLKRPLRPGDRLPVSLRFARAGAVSAILDVRALAPTATGMAM